MKSINFLILAFIFALFQTQPTLAANDEDTFTFDNPVLSGTGCPAGTTSVIASPDNTTLSLLFDRFEAKVPHNDTDNDNDADSDENPVKDKRDNPKLSHKLCNIVLGANLPKGFALDSFEVAIDFRGFTQVEKGARAVFKSLFLERKGLAPDGQHKTVLERREWKDRNGVGINEDWNIHTQKSLNLPSRCARREERKIRFSLRNIIKASIHAPRTPLPSALIMMDSTDIVGSMKFKLNIKKCNGNGNSR